MAAALADKGHGTALFGRSDPGHEPPAGNEHPHAVGADNVQPSLAGNRLDLPVEPHPLFLTGFLEPGGKDVHVPVSRGDTVPEGRRDRRGWNGDDHQVERLRDRHEIGIALDPFNLRGTRVDGVESPLIPVITEASEYPRPSRGSPTGSPDDRNRFGVKNSLPILLCSHSFQSPL